MSSSNGAAQPGRGDSTSAEQEPKQAQAADPEAGGGERIVIRDKRKIGPNAGKPSPKAKQAPATETEAEKPSADEAAEQPKAGEVDQAESTVEETTVEDVTVEEAAQVADTEPETGGLAGELSELRAALDERTSDLQRVTAEYANYRKRVDRDRTVASEQAVAAVLAALLPVLDDLDRARDHGDLEGPFAAVAEQLGNTVAKFGLVAFGAKGDPFDPTRHEAVAHLPSDEVTEPTCIDVMRRGYLLGERLVRPAMVAVAAPE